MNDHPLMYIFNMVQSRADVFISVSAWIEQQIPDLVNEFLNSRILCFSFMKSPHDLVCAISNRCLDAIISSV